MTDAKPIKLFKCLEGLISLSSHSVVAAIYFTLKLVVNIEAVEQQPFFASEKEPKQQTQKINRALCHIPVYIMYITTIIKHLIVILLLNKHKSHKN